jgi:hypothetical protein
LASSLSSGCDCRSERRYPGGCQIFGTKTNKSRHLHCGWGKF